MSDAVPPRAPRTQGTRVRRTTDDRPVVTRTGDPPVVDPTRHDDVAAVRLDGHLAARRPGMLALAFAGFFLNFWAWALLSPLAPMLGEQLRLTPLQQSLVVAVPVVVGSLGRIPVGALTDRLGARVMFPAVSLAAIVPVLALAVLHSFPALLVLGFLLGVAGTAFAVGVPFVNSWYPPQRRGAALGLFGMGMGGTAVAALTTVPLVDRFGFAAPFVIVAVVLACYAAAAWFLVRESPDRVVPTTSAWVRLRAAASVPVTWELCWLYAVAFGGYVAFSVYLVTYLRSAYGLTAGDASLRMAGFVVVAVLLRPVGGWCSDRWHPVPVLVSCFAVVTVAAAGLSVTPPLVPGGTVAFLATAAALGAGSGAVFALVARVAPPERVGAVTGLVGAAGGLGGFVPPLVMGALYGATGSYRWGLLLLALVAATTGAYTGWRMRRPSG